MEILISLMLLFAGVMVLVVIHICVVSRAFREQPDDNVQVAVQARSSSSSGGGGEAKGQKLISQDELGKLPCLEYKAEKVVVECVVCLEGFKGGDRCRLLPNCGHVFHVECIDSWLLKAPVCPICRGIVDPMKTGEGDEGNGIPGDAGVEMT